MEGNFVTYVLLNSEDKKYIGITSDIVKRLAEHNAGFSKYTAYKGPWTLFWVSKILTHTEALRLEKRMKKQKGGNGLEALMTDYSQGS